MDIQRVLKPWRMWTLTAEGRTIIFKTLPLPQIGNLAILINFLDYIIKEIEIIKEHFIW